MCTMYDVLRWIRLIETGLGKEYSLRMLPPHLYNLKFHRYAIKHGIVKKATTLNNQGFYVPRRGKTATHIWEISIGDTKHRNFYNEL